jgi:sporulation protein YlmC with PRC-barrel domain
MSAETHEDRITGGEDVLDSTGAKVGTVAYVVIKPPEMHLTDIVVSTGALLGRDIVVPTDKIAGLSGGKVHLSIDKNELETLKDYVEVHYDQPPEAWALDAGYMYPSTSVLWPAGAYYPEPSSTTVNAPAGTVGIRKGMDVVSSDGHRVGTVQAVDSDPSTGNLTDIIVRHGHLSHNDLRIPCSQISEIEADQVKLTLTREEFEKKLHTPT